MGANSSKNKTEIKQNDNNNNNNNNNNNDIDITKIPFEYKVPKVPRDADGFTQAFSVDDQEGILQFYQQFGFVIVKDIISDEEIELSKQDIWKELDKIAPGIRIDDVDSWWNWPVLKTGISASGVYCSQQSWKNRFSQNLYRVYNYLYPEENGKLLVSLDRFGIMRPTKEIELNGKVENHPEWQGPQSWFHWDINPWLYDGAEELKENEKKSNEDWETAPERSFIAENNANLSCEYEKFQSILALEDSEDDNGGFQCIPGFQHILGEWVRAFPITSRAGFVPFPKGLNIEQYAYKATMRKGSIVIWSSRLPHCNYPNMSAKKWRYCQYIKLFPERVVVNLEQRCKAISTFYLSIPPNQLDDTALQLLGFKTHPHLLESKDKS